MISANTIRFVRTIIVVSLVLLVPSVATTEPKCLPPHADAVVPETPGSRLEMIGRASVWMDNLRGGRSLLEGPLQPNPENRFTPGQEVRCQFVEPEHMQRVGGTTEKFQCKAEGRLLWVRYHTEKEHNPGVWGEILGTRLFWALDLPADAVYPIKVICEGCPDEPWRYIYNHFFTEDSEIILGKARSESYRAKLKATLPDARLYVETHRNKRSTQVFEIAQLEYGYPAPSIEQCWDQGWDWALELPHIGEVDESKRRQMIVERDALALLAAFIQHADNKPEQQRMLCMDKEIAGNTCTKPMLMVHDLGFTFGGGMERNRNKRGVFSSVNLRKFLRAPLWSDPEQCITRVRQIQTGSPVSRQVSEEGRLFLAQRLQKLIDNEQDLVDLFTIAQVDQKPVRRKNGERKAYSVQEWVAGFKQRAQSLIDHRCPDL
jgi:hypothetical protein